MTENTENRVIPVKAGIQERRGCPTDKLGHDKNREIRSFPRKRESRKDVDARQTNSGMTENTENRVIPAKAGIQEYQ